MKSKANPADPTDRLWDVIVVGGGPAGMMAAGRAGALGAQVLLLEKNPALGKKLLITGGGRCNVTNAETDVRKLLDKFAESGRYLFSAFAQWSVADTMEFFEKRGMPIKIEAEKRAFPASNTAQSVREVLEKYLTEGKVTVLTKSTVQSTESDGSTITGITLTNKRSLRAKRFILATGGKSHPETGSTGEGYGWLSALGHTIDEGRAALVPVAVKEERVQKAAGTSLADAKITLFQNDAKQKDLRGKVLFTHVGLSGPGILNMSRDIGELLQYDRVFIEIDTLPSLGYEKVTEQLKALLIEHSNKTIKNALKEIIAPTIANMILDAAEIDPETPCHSLPREARVRLMHTLKHLRFEVSHLLGMDKAIITAGGVTLDEIDFKTMRSLRYNNLFIVGDILNINRPSGGYSLQLCWTTGHVAGSAAANAD